MNVFSKFESKVEGAVDGAASAVFSSPIEPAQIAKKAEKQMKRERLVGSGRQYAPTLYNVLVNERDDKRLFGFYPTMASEIENFLYAKGTEAGMEFDTRPLVRFIPDPGLKKGRFDVIAEVVAAPIINKLRAEEMEYYGLAPEPPIAAAAQAEAESPRRKSMPGIPRPGAAAQNGKFAGLDVPARLDSGIPDSSALLPLSQSGVAHEVLPGMPVRGSQSSLPGAFPSPIQHRSSVSSGAENLSGNASPDALGVIGSAQLFDYGQQRSYRLEHRKLTVGRGKENDIVIADANASRVHARFSQDATGRWKLVDLDSTNGTQLNGRVTTSAILKSGDEITIGTTVFQFTE